MLVCSVSLRPQRHTVVADIIEAGEASDSPTTGIIFATITDAPGNALDILDAFTGQRMVEAASAAAVVDALSAHPAVVLEEISAAVAAQDAGLTAATTWATWDSATDTNVTLSGGNLIATNTGTKSADQGARVAAANGKTAGKYYFEATFITITGGSNLGVGIGTTASTYTGMGTNATTGDHGYRTGAIWANATNTGISVGAYSNTQIAGIAVDLDNRKIWFRHSPSGNWNNNASYNPATNVGGITIPAGTMVPFVTFGGNPGGVANNVVAGNFGASAFSGTVPSGFIAGWPIGTGGSVISAGVTEAATAASTQDAISIGAEAAAFLARTSGLNTTHTNAYTALINGLVADGIWSKLDLIHVYATQDSTTALLNLVSTSFNGTANGSPTFTADRGFTGASGSTVYINTSFNPATATSPKFTVNSAHMSVWNLTEATVGTNGCFGASTAAAFTPQSYVVPRYSDGNAYIRLNVSSPTADNIANATAAGHYVGNRSGSSAVQAYKNGSLLGTHTNGSSSVPNATFYSLAHNNNGTAQGVALQLAAISVGSSLTSTDATNCYNRLRTYLTTVGLFQLSVTGTPTTGAAVGNTYSFTVTGVDGTPPYTYSVASGSLPSGITVNSSSGVVSGTPTTAGSYTSIVLRVTDAASATADLAPFTITVYATWSPAVLGPWAWWKFDAMSEADTVAVASVADSSGNGRTLTTSGSPTAKAAAQNGLKALNFAGGTKYATFASASALTSGSFFAVNKAAASPSGTTFGGVCDMGSDTQVNHYTYSGAVYSDFLTPNRKTAGAVTVNVWHQVMFWSAASDWGHAMDGTDKFTTTSNAVAGRATSSYLASDGDTATWRHQGEFGEVVILSNKPTTTDRQRLEGYLAHKWGIAGSLPGGHPYKSAPP